MATAWTTLLVDVGRRIVNFKGLCILLAVLLSCHPGFPCSACCRDLSAANCWTSLFILPERRNICDGEYGSLSPRNFSSPSRRRCQSSCRRTENFCVLHCLYGCTANRCRDSSAIDDSSRQSKLTDLSPRNDRRNFSAAGLRQTDISQDDKHTYMPESNNGDQPYMNGLLSINGSGGAFHLPDQHWLLRSGIRSSCGSLQTLAGTVLTTSRQQTGLANSHCKFIEQQLPRYQPWEIRLCSTQPSRVVDCHPRSYFQRTIKNVNSTNMANDMHHANFLAQGNMRHTS